MVKTRIWSLVSAALTAFVLSACGGGAEFGGTTGGTLGGTTGGDGPPAGAPASLTVSPAQATIPADGVASTLITAELTDLAGNPVADRTLTFETDAGTLSSDSAVTDVEGLATVALRAPVVRGTANIVVRDAGSSLTGTTVVEFVSSTPASVEVQLLPEVVAPGEPTTVVTTVRDAQGSPVEGQIVSFDVLAGPGGTFSEVSVTTDANGRAQTAFTPSQIGDYTLRARLASNASDTAQLTVASSGQVATTLILLASTPTLTSDASDVSAGVTLTAILRDANNNVVPGVPVVFSTQDSGEINVVNPATTDQNGRVSAVLTTGGDPTNRSVRVTASAQELSDEITIRITGTLIDLTGPDTTQTDTPTEYSVLLTDGANAGVAGQVVRFTTEPDNTLSAGSVQTNESGLAAVELTVRRAVSTLTATALGSTDTLEIIGAPDRIVFVRSNASCSALSDADLIPATPTQEVSIGLSQPVSICWTRNGTPVANGTTVNFAATRGTFPNGAAVATVNGKATVNVRSSESGLSIITASAGSLSTTTTVEFVATTPARIDVQASPSTVPPNQTSEITVVVRDANNNLVKNATVEFSISDLSTGSLSAGTAITNSQGVARVIYSATSQTSGTEDVKITARVRNTNISDSALLTVGGRAVSIFLGTGSQILLKDESTYQMTYTVVVSDSAGNPVPDATFRLTLVPISYFEGTFEAITGVCFNEDGPPYNDILDVGEDFNNNGRLEPGRVAVLPATVLLDPDGSAQFLVTYPKDVGQFVLVEITGTATVAGSESTVKRRFVLPIAEDDEDNLPGVSPWGVDGDCATADVFEPAPELPAVSIAAADTQITQAESDSFAVTVLLSTALPDDVLVPVIAGGAGDTASLGDDYVAATSVRIPAGARSASFNVQILADSAVEDDEIFTLSLGQPSNSEVTLGTNAQSRVIILADADQPRVSFETASRNRTVAEGDNPTYSDNDPDDQATLDNDDPTLDATVTLTIQLDRPSTESIRVPVLLSDGTATLGTDFSHADAAPTNPREIVVIPAGATSASFNVRIAGDLEDETNEDFTVTLDDVLDSNALLLDRNVSNVARVVIVDDDS